LILLTLPVSNAVWREVLGVAADVDTANESTPTPLIVTATSTSIPPATITTAPSLPVVVMTQVPDTLIPESDIISQTATVEEPPAMTHTDLPLTISTPVEAPATETPTILEPVSTEPLQTEEQVSGE
jgi:hypothetical protein